jgi:dolichol-phosphate mannosyltransferase
MWATRIAYRVIHVGSTLQLPVDAGDFKLLSRTVVRHLLQLRESDPYMRGLVVWLGFNQTFVPYERDARYAGRTHFPFFSRNPWKTFVLGMTSFSFLPMYACAVLAAVGAIISIALLVVGLGLLIRGSAVTGMTAVVGLMLFLWSTTLAAIAAVGLYVIRIYKDVRGRPPYIIQSTIGLASDRLIGREVAGTRAEHVEQ